MYKLTRMEAETIRRTDQADWDIHDLRKNANRLYIHACRNPNLWDKYGDNRLFQEMRTKPNFIIVYHPQIDGQTERVNQFFQDMLRMYVMNKLSKWENYLYLVEFAYNNGNQSSLGMIPFEALYGKGC